MHRLFPQAGLFHHNTGATFRDYCYNMKYQTYRGEVAYRMTKGFSLSLNIDTQRYNRAYGHAMYENPPESKRFDGAGISHESWMTGLSLGYGV